eukprot:gene29536-33217_t
MERAALANYPMRSEGTWSISLASHLPERGAEAGHRVPVDDAVMVAIGTIEHRHRCIAHFVTRLLRPDDAAWVPGDPLALRRILGNLVDTARRHGSAAGRRWGRAACWILRVEEDGPSVPVAMLHTLGESFGRIDPSRHRADGGAGLGLAI